MQVIHPGALWPFALLLGLLAGCSSTADQALDDASARDSNADVPISADVGEDGFFDDGLADDGTPVADSAATDSAKATDTHTEDTAAPPFDTAAADTTPPPGACNAVTVSPSSTFSHLAGAPPTPAGGTIADGDWKLTDVGVFDGAATDSTGPGSGAERIVISGTSAQLVEQDGTSSVPDWSNATLTPPGATFLLKVTCGTLSPDPTLKYTAVSATNLWIFSTFGGMTRRFNFVRTP